MMDFILLMIFRIQSLILRIRCFLRGYHVYRLKYSNETLKTYECVHCWQVLCFGQQIDRKAADGIDKAINKGNLK